MKSIKNTLFTVSLAAIALCSGCATVESSLARNVDLKEYKRAYLEPQKEDEFQMYRAIFWELNDLGFEVVGVPFKDPSNDDFVVKYSYEGSWDIARYLQSFQIKMMNAKSDKLISTTSYYSRGLWRGVRDGRLEDAFNEFRKSAGLPPTKQFSGK